MYMQDSIYEGSSDIEIWRALRATTAAPRCWDSSPCFLLIIFSYFNEVIMNGEIHQDGGVLINNPTALGTFLSPKGALD
jgi:hypothetical protein